ncbi:MAG: PD-(D/E)XK nuclease family protein, partial [Clostridia bacterium]|nr:PD-(D/E)XK nuclease family protein [Clostridia bacterium]
MGLRIVYGKAGSGKSHFCFSEISKLLDTQENIIIITPEQFSFTAEKKLMQVTKKGAVLNAEVLTLSRMAYRVIQEVGNDNVSSLSRISKENEDVIQNNLDDYNNINKTISISKAGKAMLINSIIEKNKDKLKFIGKSSENIDLAMQAITEFKKHKITPGMLEEKMEEIQEQYLKTKLNDMKLIYENFENSISSKWMDDTDLLTYLEQNIGKTDIAKDAIIYIDEFMGFTKQEYAVLAKLIKLAKHVTVTLCIDTLKPSANPVTDIFYSNKKTLSRLLQMLEENDLKLDEPINVEEIKNNSKQQESKTNIRFETEKQNVNSMLKNYEANDYNIRFKNNELKHIEANLFNTNPTIYNKNVENIELFLAKNQYSEVENLAKQIINLIKKENYRYNEISVITKDLQQYSSLVRAIFSKYEVPVFIDEKRDLNQNIFIKYVLTVLEVLNKNFSYDSVISYIKSGFLDLEDDELFKFENYCTKWGIKYNKWKNDFVYDKQNNEAEINRFNEIRKSIVEPLLNLKDKINKDKTAKNICLELYNFLIEQKIQEKLLTKMQELEDRNMLDLQTEYKKSYEIIISLLDDISDIFDDEKMSIDKFTNCLKIGLKNSELSKIPATQDQVVVGDVDRSRSHKVKTIFIIGLNDGVFPSNNKQEGFLNDNDRELLKENGLELANTTIENLYEENFNIYKAFTTAEEKLYLSYASSDSNGKTLRPSMLIIKIKKIFPGLLEKSDIINTNYTIANYMVTYEELLENIFNLQNNRQMDKIWYEVYNYYKSQNSWNLKLQNDLLGLDYTNIPQNISKENVEKLYGNTLNTSVSRLEKYRSCPFSYYLQYGLNLKEKEELKVQSFNTGSFMHETIDTFFERVKEENIELPTLLAEEELIQKLVDKIIEEELELSKNAIFTATPKYKVLVRRLKKIVARALKFIVEGLVYSEFELEGTEVEFGKKGKYQPIILTLEDGKRVEITGKIDRIDTAKTENGKYLRIIDYKSSAKNIDLNEVYAGLQIQLLTYLDAVCKKEDLMPAGILYFSLLEQMVKSDKKITEEEIEDEIRKNFKMKGLILADVKVIKLHDKTLKAGSSKIVPAGLTASGEVNKKFTSGVGKEEFKVLQDYIYKTIKEISKEILKGRIDIKPY